MEYKPRYSQPFTLAEAVLLDIPTITQEITRLQHSLQHLRRTQDELRDYITSSSTPDNDIEEAFAENSQVIGSQEERVGILKVALSHKGIIASSHYDLHTSTHTQHPPCHTESAGTPQTPPTEESGIDL
ncbi:hypothetical protein JAAARDRAFT_28227 [Jaapia argillacea MUCL 33604]|uniref:Uncharacterized protein n=1 Tax=Jaapia argillacea MUCL 33604 TaxID=933084 RepID=A0A067QEH8_9AGAM|nr:hypothetical protein JAAARDRAFT_28227 [Jaapia argillacea MUCL 33604]